MIFIYSRIGKGFLPRFADRWHCRKFSDGVVLMGLQRVMSHLVMSNGNPRGDFFYPTFTLMIDSHIQQITKIKLVNQANSLKRSNSSKMAARIQA